MKLNRIVSRGKRMPKVNISNFGIPRYHGYKTVCSACGVVIVIHTVNGVSLTVEKTGEAERCVVCRVCSHFRPFSRRIVHPIGA